MRYLIIFFSFILIINLLGCAPAKQNDISIAELQEKSRSIKELTYKADYTPETINVDSKSPIVRTETESVWIKDNIYRKEKLITENKSTTYIYGIIVDGDKGIIEDYFEILNGKIITKPMAVGQPEGMRKETFFKFIDDIAPDKAEVIGIENVNNEESVVIKPNLTDIKTVWISLNKAVPTKVEYVNGKIITFSKIIIGPGTVSSEDLFTKMPKE